METTRQPTPEARPLGHIIERPRLTALLAESGARVILLMAPAGYGKTTLARQWAARQEGPVAWYRTTRISGDVAALAVGLDSVLAERTQPPGRDPKRIAAIAAVNASPVPLARALVSTYQGLTQEVLLVLDDYETAGTKEADELVRALVDGLHVRFLVTSRARPTWFSPRLTTYGEGLEVGIDELTMTDEEALDVLSSSPSPGDPRPLLETARGWPAVIGLAAMRAAKDLPSPQANAPGTLYDFIAGEILDSVPAEVAVGLTLLAAASIGDVTTAVLVLGDDASSVLGEASRHGLVQIETDGTLSLHPLLRELLLTRLHEHDRTVLLDRLGPLVGGQRWDEALAASEALQDGEFVSRALELALPELLHGGRVATLRRWAVVGRTSGAQPGLVAYADAEVALREADFSRAIARAERATESLSGDLAARAHILAAQAAYLTDRAARARQHLLAVETLSRSVETRQGALWVEFSQAIDEQREDVAVTLATFEKAEDNSVEHHIRCVQGRIALALLEGGLEECLDEAQLVLTELTPDVDPMVRSSFLNACAYSFGAAARYRASLEAADGEDQLANEYGITFVSRYALVNKARACIGLRRFALAARALTRLETPTDGGQDPWMDAYTRMHRARLYLSSGDPTRAYGVLALKLSPRATAGTYAHHLALRALTLAVLQRTREAIESAEEALRISRSREIISLASITQGIATFDKSGTRAVDLFQSAMESGALDEVVLGLRASPAFAARMAELSDRDALITLLAESNDAALARRIGIEIPRTVRRSSPLSRREIEVHELMAQGRTNREIAVALFITESTTKLHVRHILAKLGVRSRVEAVRIWQPPEDSDDPT